MPEFWLGLDRFLLYVKREFRFILATSAASGIGYLGSAAAPIIVQAMIDAGLDHHQAGDLGTIELLALAVASALITPYVPVVSHRKLAMVGMLVAALGLVLSAFSVSYAAMITGRLVIGVGSGLAISGANAAIAAREDAERIFAIIWTMGGGLYALLAVGLPRVVEGGNYPLGFGALLVLCIAALPCIFWIPPKPDAARARLATGGDQAMTGTPGDSEPEFVKPFGLLALIAIAGMFIYSAGEQALWSFAYNLPIEAGVDPTLASQILAFATLMGLVGGGIAALLGVRLGRVLPIVVGTLLSALGRWLYIGAAGTGTLLAGGFFWGVGFYFVSPYQIGIAAALDRKGRVAVASAAAMNFGYAVGPGMAGRILQYMDRDWLMAVIAGSTVASLLLILPLAVRVERGARVARSRAGRAVGVG